MISHRSDLLEDEMLMSLNLSVSISLLSTAKCVRLYVRVCVLNSILLLTLDCRQRGCICVYVCECVCVDRLVMVRVQLCYKHDTHTIYTPPANAV